MGFVGLAILVLIIVGSLLANRWPIADAVIWCALGVAVAFIPGFPTLRFDPKVALYALLPPLIYAAAVELPWPEFRSNLRPIGMLAIGLVAISTVSIAALAHYLMDFPWAVGFTLGALTAPTDPVAASSVASKVGIPHRLMAILEGESLVNDAVSLTILRLATAAVLAGTFSISGGLLRFALILVGEPLYGWLVALGISRIRKKIADSRIEIAISVLTPFLAYLLPELLGGSGILATVAAGMYIGERRSTLVPAGTRLHAVSFWSILVFLLNGTFFLAVGIELRQILDPSGMQVLLWGLAVGAGLAALRLFWCAAVWIALRFSRWGKGVLPGSHLVVLAWSGMRGPISLAAALSIPLGSATPFPHRGEVISITAVAIAFTLMLQGILLTPLVRLLGVDRDGRRAEEEVAEQEARGMAEAADAAIKRLDRMESEGSVPAELAERLRQEYRLERQTARSDSKPTKGQVRAKLIEAERKRLLELRNGGEIGDYALGRLERDLDLRETVLKQTRSA